MEIDINPIGPFTSGGFTLSTWVNFDGYDSTYDGIFSSRSGYNWGLNIEGGTTKNWDFRFVTGTEGNPASLGLDSPGFSASSSVNKWYHLAMTYTTDGTNATGTAYVNGALINSVTTAADNIIATYPDFGAATTWRIGDDSAADGRELDGSIDDLAIWDSALTAADVIAIYNGGNLGVDAPTSLAALTAPPDILALSPTNNAIDAPIGANLVATFNENIFTNTTGSIVITNMSDNVVFATIPIGDTNQIDVVGNTLTVTPASNLAFESSYAVLIDTNALMDAATNYFAGITSSTTWQFVTAAEDLTAPSITNKSPENGTTAVLINTDLVATFDEPIMLKSGGTITVTDLTDGSSTTVITLPDPQVTSPSGDDLLINLLADLEFNTDYSVRISSDAVEDYALVPNGFTGIADDTTWRFKTRSQPVAGLLIPSSKIVSSTYGVIGKLVAIDVPYLGGAADIPNSSLPQGPDFPQDADYGFTFRDTGANFLQYYSGTSAWEPDGTALDDAKTYGIVAEAASEQNINNPQVTWTFDLEDDIVINAIYASWTDSGTGRRTIWGYTEGTNTDAYVQVGGVASHLVLQWTDAASATHNGNFQRIFTNSVMVEGGDGFTLKATEEWNVGPIDAVVLDVTFPPQGTVLIIK
jgi:hypothetical protein